MFLKLPENGKCSWDVRLWLSPWTRVGQIYGTYSDASREYDRIAALPKYNTARYPDNVLVLVRSGVY